MTSPPFQGLHALLTQLDRLVGRPAWRLRRGPGEIRGDRPTPILCLTHDGDDRQVLTGLHEWFAAAGVVVASVDVPAVERAAAEKAETIAAAREGQGSTLEMPLLPLLDELWQRLGAAQGPYRHYGLTDRLTRQDHPGLGTVHQKVRRTLDDWYGDVDRPVLPASEGGEPDGAPNWLRRLNFLAALARRPARWLWRRAVWPFGAVPRWLMNQRFMVPRHSTSFAEFAERLTPDRRRQENQEELRRLLVHAFLADLRLHYRPVGWRPRRWRRTTYLVLLLHGVTMDNQGWRLLKLINDVRNESTEHDPLFVLASVRAAPGKLAADPVGEAEATVNTWYDRLPGRRQALNEEARFLYLRLPPPGTAPDPVDKAAWGRNLLRPRKPPLLARRWVIVTTVLALLLAVTGVAGPWAWVRWQQDCLPSVRAGIGVRWLPAERACVGYSDDTGQLFGSDERLLAAQRALFEQNRLARRLQADNPRRVLVTLIYFADLTHSVADPGTDSSTSEEMEGLLLRQRQQNVKDQALPLLRIIVANGGDRMTAARTVVDDLLADLVRQDETVLGVVGMGLTVPATESAIGALGNLGVPVVATTLTGEALPERSPLYFQLPPGNQVQAELLAEYARWAGQPVTIYHPPTTDNYLDSLLKLTVRAIGPGVGQRRWEQLVGEIKIDCGTDRIAFFIGREHDFPPFLRAVVQQCDTRRPTVIGSDTVARFVSQGELRLRDEFNGISMAYVSMGARIVLSGRTCRSGYPDPAAEGAGGGGPAAAQPLHTFCAGYRAFRNLTEPGPPEEPDTTAFARRVSQPAPQLAALPWPGERIGLAYDAGGLFLAAVERNLIRRRVPDPRTGQPNGEAGHRPHRGAIAQELTQLTDFQGASGRISFHESRTGRTRAAAVLSLTNVHNLDEVPRCRFTITMPADDAGTRPGGSANC